MSSSDMPQLLTDIASEVDRGFLEDTFTVQEHTYKLRLLSDGETNWKNRYIDGMTSALSILSQRRSATLAVACRAIDGHDVTQLFAPAAPGADDKEGSDKEKAYKTWMASTTIERQFLVAKKMYDYFSKRPVEFTAELYDHFTGLEKRREEVIKNVKKS